MSLTRVRLGDQSWELDDEKLTLADAFLIKSGTGLALKPFFEGVAEMDPTCLQGLVWFLRRKAGENVNVADIDFVITELVTEQEESPTTGAAPAVTSETAPA